MLDNMLCGRYIARKSPVHAADARAKLGLCFIFLASVLISQSYAGLIACSIVLIYLYACAHISPHEAMRAVFPLLFIVVIAALLNIFFTRSGEIYASWWVFCISDAGLHQAAFVSFRLLLLLLGASLLTLTTTTLDITAAFECILAPAARIGLPAHELAQMAGIALQFLPQFARELTYTWNAQTSRGASMSGSLKNKVHVLASLLVPLFTSAFRHAETLSFAMDARVYNTSTKRSRLHEFCFGARDIIGVVICAALLVSVIISNITGI